MCAYIVSTCVCACVPVVTTHGHHPESSPLCLLWRKLRDGPGQRSLGILEGPGAGGGERRTRKDPESEAVRRRMTMNGSVNKRQREGERGSEEMEEGRKGKKMESQRGC